MGMPPARGKRVVPLTAAEMQEIEESGREQKDGEEPDL
jgi:hypothetical protein